jgi:hypothetical protein
MTNNSLLIALWYQYFPFTSESWGSGRPGAVDAAAGFFCGRILVKWRAERGKKGKRRKGEARITDPVTFSGQGLKESYDRTFNGLPDK